MIKFFRKIRQNLLNKNKVGKYLLYAIGEVLLVVIGILIALQLNNQKELRKQRIVEIDILEGIRKDILRDTIDLNTNIRGTRNGIETVSFLIDHILNKKELNKNFVSELHYITVAKSFIILHDSHFQEAKQKGLSIISNETLRDDINNLYEFDYEFLSLLVNNTENIDYSNILSREIGPYFGYDGTDLTVTSLSYKKFLEHSDKILYHINSSRGGKYQLLYIHRKTLEAALKVADDIKIEIDALKTN
ncbi:DUF6090 family protein [Winogradskyella ouciana]|uniref:Uncharacterized protein n=1 Tax=Winogradskyella ouciana TaxID=2608631 RepID=A0A7K1G838_9FLAO|nr:DUF6090 family protein [Winogradskyella ouciana]MTE25452.1 hypothetical protein [Winogradskyella ouciana]